MGNNNFEHLAPEHPDEVALMCCVKALRHLSLKDCDRVIAAIIAYFKREEDFN